MNVYIATALKEKERTYLQSKLKNHTLIYHHDLDKEDQLDRFLQCEICYGNVRPSWLKQSQQLKWVQLISVGFGYYQKLAEEAKFTMTHMVDFFTIPVAETVLAGILSLYRGMDRFAVEKLQKDWKGVDQRDDLRRLYKKEVLILGGGNIGQRCKTLLQAFDAKITIYGRNTRNADIAGLEALKQQIPLSDIIINTLPGTMQTVGLIDKKRLQLFKSNALFINVGRGSVVDEAALSDLLAQHKIGGAYLDVFQKEPLPVDNPLWSCPNTIIGQHSGGGYRDEKLDKIKSFLINYNQYQKGLPLNHVVDLEKGY